MKFALLVALSTASLVASLVGAFTSGSSVARVESRSSSTPLHAIGALAKKAKEADLRKYVEAGIDDNVREKYDILRKALIRDASIDDMDCGPLQRALTKRKGTIAIIAEFKRKTDALEPGYISDIYEPKLLSPVFRECGASAIAVMADERMGGCSYDDVDIFIEEQRRSGHNVLGSLSVINNDLIVDELQIARSAAMGVAACVITLDVVGEEKFKTLLTASQAVGMESIAAISTKEEAQKAVDLGARIILVMCLDEPETKAQIVADLVVPEGRQVCTIANILTRKNQQMQEIEDAWALRDKGFNCVWVGDALYKAGDEHPGAVIKAMCAKSSLKFASPKARTGKGEGAREYLGDIMM